MKTLLIALFLSMSALANTVELKINLSSKISFLTYTKIKLVYASTLTSRSCTRYSGDIFSDRTPRYYEQYISLTNGMYSGTINISKSQCKAKLISIDLDTQIDRKALAQNLGLSMSDIDKNRLSFNFHVTYPTGRDTIYRSELSFEKLYVAGRNQPIMTLYSRAEIAPVIGGEINLDL